MEHIRTNYFLSDMYFAIHFNVNDINFRRAFIKREKEKGRDRARGGRGG